MTSLRVFLVYAVFYYLIILSRNRMTKSLSYLIVSLCLSYGATAQAIEQLEVQVDLEADAVRPAEQFDHQNDLPD